MSVMAQSSKQVTGKVVDNNGQPIVGAAVVVDGTTTGTVTDIDGNYSLNVPEGASLSVSFVGYNKETKPADGTTIDFSLTEEYSQLDELVVVGYGVQKKSDLTGSIASIKADDIQKVAAPNAMQAMQARIPGLDVQQSSGESGGSLSINLRGARSINASNGPLILVDGVEYGSTLDINPQDIASMEVLKDASSTAIYGTRGANGVIIITTKRGKKTADKCDTKSTVNFHFYNSWNAPTSSATSMYGDAEVNRLIAEKEFDANYATYKETGVWGTKTYTAEDALAGYNLDDGTPMLDIVKDKSYTDWGDLLIENSTSQGYELSLNSGNANTQLGISLGALFDRGLMANDKMTRYNGRLSVDHKLNDYVNAGMSMLFTYKNHDRRNSGVYSQALKMTTITHAYLKDGSINATPNPLYAAHCSPLQDDGGNYQRNVQSTRFFGNTYLELTPIKGLVFRTMLAVDRNNSRSGTYQDYQSQQRYQSGQTSVINQNPSNSTNLTWDNTINYNTDFNGSTSNLNVLLGHEAVRKVSESLTVSGNGGGNHLRQSSFYDVSKMTTVDTPSSSYTKQTMLSFFGRLQYSFASKYLASFSMRADGSSVLAEGNKWAAFPSASIGWRVSEEDFMESTKDVLSNLKIRLAYGVAGNAAIDPYQTMSTLSGQTVSYYMGGNDVAGKLPSHMGNKDLGWEKTSSVNLGVDFGIINNRFSGSVDVYWNKTNDLLFYQTGPASSVFPTVLSNIGKTEGTGFEIQLDTRILEIGDFTWDVNWSYSHSTDEITKLAAGVDQFVNGTTAFTVGQRIHAYYDYEADGIWNIGEFDKYIESWKARHPGEEAQFESTYGLPGTIKIKDQNDDGKISAEDDRIHFNKDPKHIFGANTTFSWKGLSLSAQFFARMGGYLSYDMNSQLNYETANWGSAVDYWTPTNTGAKFPTPGKSVASSYSTYRTALMYEKADYFKVKDITLAYKLPKDVVSKVGLSSARIYGSLKNFITKSKIDDYDSERGGSIAFPLQKQGILGISLEF
ncbi:MAG: TonB-dependent receptor [Bacteroidales bacterium]|nr:TonB-dependent receptor [Bacteroidales bacterium]